MAKASRQPRISIAGLCLAGMLTLVLPSAHADPTISKVGAGKTAPATVKNRIAIQINEADSKKWHAVLGNIRNIQADLGQQNVAIVVVAISYGLGMLTAESLAANDVQEALASGVAFVACGNSMQAQKVTKDDLTDGVTITPSGYVELMQRQQQGWAYLRP